jgi:pectate lyase
MLRIAGPSLLAISVLLAAAAGPARGPKDTPAATQPTTAPAEAAGLIGFAAVAAEGLERTTGGAGGPEVTVSTAEALLAAIKGDEPAIVHVQGRIELPKGMHHVGSNKSILGIGRDAALVDGGLEIRGTKNVIIRNLAISGSPADAITVTDRAHHVWIDHCDLSACDDGLIDIVHQASYVTVSWCRFSRHHKTMLIGSSNKLTSDTGYLKVTVHHNWFDGSASRHPRVRFGQVHVFNNLYERNGYGVASTMGAAVLVEGNVFRSVASPTLTRYGSSGPGNLVQRDNRFENSGQPQSAGVAFDPKSYYPYELDDPDKVADLVREGTGVGKL